eukprot:s1478_g5.t1
MLRVWWLSGQLAAFIPIEEMLDVRGLKQRLNQLHQLPPRFRQRVLFYGENLADAAMLTFPMDLTLVLLPFEDVPQTQVDELAVAARRGSATQVESMLHLPQDPDLPHSDGRTPLRMATIEGHVEVVRLLLEAGADKNATGNHGSTALMTASQRGHVEVVRLLLEAGADKNATNNNGSTALKTASQGGHVDVVRLLLEAGADKDAADKRGFTALMAACFENENVEVVRLLLEAGADKNVADKDGVTAWMAASLAGHGEVERELQKASRNEPPPKNNPYGF